MERLLGVRWLRDRLSQGVTLEPALRWGRGAKQALQGSGRGGLGVGNSTHTGPEAGPGLVCGRNSNSEEPCVAGAE